VKMARDSSSSSGLDIENISVSDYTRGLIISDKTRKYLDKISTTKVDPYCIPFQFCVATPSSA